MLTKDRRTTESGSLRSRQDDVPNKPAGLATSIKAAVIRSAVTATTAADKDDEPDSDALTEDEEVVDDLEYSAGSKGSLVHPPIFPLAHIMPTTQGYRSVSHPQHCPLPLWSHLPVRQDPVFGRFPQMYNDRFPTILFLASSQKLAVLRPLGQTWMWTPFKAMSTLYTQDVTIP